MTICDGSEDKKAQVPRYVHKGYRYLNIDNSCKTSIIDCILITI